jgi:hypothetical protein
MSGERRNSHAKATAIGVVFKRAATLESVSDWSGEKPPSGNEWLGGAGRARALWANFLARRAVSPRW